MKFFIVDAFTDKAFGGNPAGVVLIPEGEDFPPEDVMIKTAAELRYSETAFVKSINSEHDANDDGGDSAAANKFQVRYFTPAAEVELCGHATIGTFYALNKSGLLKANADGKVECLAHTLSGDIAVTCEEDFILMDMAEAKHLKTLDDAVEVDRLYEIMGSEYDQSIGLKPMIITTGLPDIMMPVATLKELNSLSPDFLALSKLSEGYNVVGVHAFTLDTEGQDDNSTCHTRNFAPLYDIDEEAATGTASGALTYYLCLNQKINPQDECTFVQGEAMDRPSVIKTTIDAGEQCRIRVGGPAAILAEGEIYL